jgi:hypothetical protein
MLAPLVVQYAQATFYLCQAIGLEERGCRRRCPAALHTISSPRATKNRRTNVRNAVAQRLRAR